MDPAPPADVGGETKERRKIHFSVPATAPSQLDPRQVEMIRRRRPTPATLFRVADQSSPDDENATHQWVVGENGVLKPKRINPNVYQPPSLKAVQRMAQAHMQTLGDCNAPEDPPEGEESEDCLSLGEREEESPSTPTADPQDLMDSQSERQSRSETGEEPAHRDEEHEDEEEEEEKDKEEEEEEEEREKEQVEVGSEQGEKEEARGRGE